MTADAQVPATFAGAVQLRPFEDDSLALEGIVAVDSDGRVGAAGMASARLPRVGRVFARVEGDDLRGQRAVRLLGGVALDWDRLRVEGGVLASSEDLTGWFAGARVSSRHRDGLPSFAVVDDIELRGAGARSMLTLIARLDADLYDRDVHGVLLRVRDAGLGLAYAQELRMAIEALERAGKQVVCHFESASGSDLYACSAASQIWVDEAGSIQLLGPRFNVMLFGEALQNLGIRADFIRIGRFKSAVEQYTNRRGSADALQQRDVFLDDVYRRMVQDMQSNRPDHNIGEWVDHGLFTSWEAVEHGVAHEAVGAEAIDAAAAGRVWPASPASVPAGAGSYDRRHTTPHRGAGHRRHNGRWR